jgi:hypothetical protein
MVYGLLLQAWNPMKECPMLCIPNHAVFPCIVLQPRPHIPAHYTLQFLAWLPAFS